MKKIMLFLSLAVISYFNAFAQMTPEAAMAACPDLPTEAQMIAYLDGDGDPELYEKFKEALDKAQRNSQEMTAKMNPMHQVEKALDKKKIEGTNVNIGQAKNMSKAQQEALAKQAVKGRLGNMGISMEDLEAVQSGKMTEKELADKIMAQQTGGLTVTDMEFIANNNLSAEETQQFMEMAGIDQKKLQAYAAKGQKQDARNAKLAPLIEKIERLNKRGADLMQKPSKLRREAQAAGKEIYNRTYRQQVDRLNAEIADLEEKMIGGDAMSDAQVAHDKAIGKQIEIKQDQINKFMHEYYTKSIPLWRNGVIAAMNVYKNEYLPLERERKQVFSEMYKLTGDPSYEAHSKVPETAADYFLSAADYIDWYNEDPEKL